MGDNNNFGIKIFSSVLWGFGLATIFSEICKTKNCVVLKGIQPDKIKNKIFEKPEDHFNENKEKEKNKCYKLVEEETQCTEHSISV